MEDAGCTDADVLNHCRQPRVHTRGCWALDLVLGKEQVVTEEEWLTSTDPFCMLLHEKPSDRKCVLYTVAVCRHEWHRLSDWRCRRAVELAELFADRKAAEEDISTATAGIRCGSKLSIAVLVKKGLEDLVTSPFIAATNTVLDCLNADA